MKVLLIQPFSMPQSLAGDDTSMFEPLALEYLSAGVKGLCETRLLDMRLEKKLSQTLSEYRPDIVGITGYSVHVNVVRKIAVEVRAFDPEIKIVLGGHHASVAPDDFLDIAPDCIIRGEGVFVFRDVMVVYQGKKRFEDIQDVELNRQGGTVLLRPSTISDLNRYPFPDRELSRRYREHYFSYWMKPVATLRSSSGCKFKCSFCSLWETYRGKYYVRKPEKILEEILSIKEECIYFCDDESFLDPQNMKELAGLLKKHNVKKRYHMMVRADTVVRNKELLALWKEVGLERVFIGIEGYNDKLLKKLNKGTTAKINEEAIKYIQGLGVSILSDFIIDQEYDREDFKALRKYVKDMKLSSAIFTILTPLPGTQFFRNVEHMLIDREFEHFDVMHTLLPTKLPLRQFYKEVYTLYKNSSSVSERLKFISQFSLKDMITVIKLYRKVMAKLKNNYKNPGLENINVQAG
ncbi:B12-binding domain-containing radical SAM protein [Desulfotomaculum copahuensis]|uniref:Uncharacterized protein n=1 Tax=Desulfotomaculum copahuensis TaxID=1838280 RepID=A0A1B7LG16_9FIRM|nr:radical SAM protein [Desulfotomaculum copahuensis]OAT83626.1 hypothetical protein A6M21_08050 [Desulfotomaculum copahuensis]